VVGGDVGRGHASYAVEHPQQDGDAQRPSPDVIRKSKSLFGNYEGRRGEGFWLWPRRRVPSIPAAGCKERANAGHGQKTRRPEGFRGKGRQASLLLSRRSTRGILLRRASPSGLFPENSDPRSFQTGSKGRCGPEIRQRKPDSRSSETQE